MQANQLVRIPSSISNLAGLQLLNLNKNKFEDVYAVIDQVAQLPRLNSLFINLSEEDQVDYIMRSLPNLEFLNGLEVDRDLEEEEEEEEENH